MIHESARFHASVSVIPSRYVISSGWSYSSEHKGTALTLGMPPEYAVLKYMQNAHRPAARLLAGLLIMGCGLPRTHAPARAGCTSRSAWRAALSAVWVQICRMPPTVPPHEPAPHSTAERHPLRLAVAAGPQTSTTGSGRAEHRGCLLVGSRGGQPSPVQASRAHSALGYTSREARASRRPGSAQHHRRQRAHAKVYQVAMDSPAACITSVRAELAVWYASVPYDLEDAGGRVRVALLPCRNSWQNDVSDYTTLRVPATVLNIIVIADDRSRAKVME